MFGESEFFDVKRFVALVFVLFLFAGLRGQPLFRGHVTTKTYDLNQHPSNTSLFRIMARSAGLPVAEVDTLVTDYFICNDTIVSFTKVAGDIVVEVAEFGGYQNIYDKKENKYLKMPIRKIQIEESGSKRWKYYRSDKIENDLNHNAKLKISPNGEKKFLAQINDEVAFSKQVDIGGRFLKVFNRKGVYETVAHFMSDTVATKSSFVYYEDPDLTCGAYIRDTNIKSYSSKEIASNDDVDVKLMPSKDRQPFPAGKYLDDKGMSFTSIDEFLGSWVYVDLWATWCKPCLEELPHLKVVRDSFVNEPITFLSLCLDDVSNMAKWNEIGARYDIDWINWFGTKGQDAEVVDKFNVQLLPRYLLVDPLGRVASVNAPRPSDLAIFTLINNALKASED